MQFREERPVDYRTGNVLLRCFYPGTDSWRYYPIEASSSVGCQPDTSHSIVSRRRFHSEAHDSMNCDRLSAETPASSTQSGRCGGMYNYPERDRVEIAFNSIPAIPRISFNTVSAEAVKAPGPATYRQMERGSSVGCLGRFAAVGRMADCRTGLGRIGPQNPVLPSQTRR